MIEINKIYNENCLDTMSRIEDNSIDLVFTSPPYNMRIRVRNGEYTEREQSSHFSKKYEYYDDALSIEEYYKLHKQIIKELLRISNIIFINIQIVTGSKEAWFKLIGEYSQQIKDIIIWDKGWGQPAMHEGVINRATELILIMGSKVNKGRQFNKYYFNRGQMEDIWRINKTQYNKNIKASFPEQLVAKAIIGWSKEQDLIYDPFIGSGTTSIVCKKLNRNYIGSELIKENYDIAQQRINNTLPQLF